VGREHLQAYLNLKDSQQDWTFVCSPEIRDEDKTENYITNDTYPPTPDKHYITAGDLALFMIKEVENPGHIKQRVGISAT
jgi:putative NADH-flavin reductase